MTQFVCDICNKVKEMDDRRYVTLKDWADKPMMEDKEICVWCAKKIQEYINELR